MKFRQNLLTTAVVAGLFSANAFAAVNIDAASPGAPAVYASELTVPAAGLSLPTTAGNVLAVTGLLSPNPILNSTDVRVKFTLGGSATWGTAITNANFTLTNPAVAFAGAIQVLSGGLATDNFVEFTFNTGVGGIFPASANTAYQFAPPTVKVTNAAAISITAETRTADNFGAATPKTKTNAYIDFQKSLTLVCTDSVSPQRNKVDVTQNSLYFDNALLDVNSDQGSVTLNFAAKLDASSATPATASVLLSSATTTLTSAGGWAAFNQTGGSAVLGAVGNYTARTYTGNDAAFTYTTAGLINGLVGNAQLLTVTVPNPNTVKIGDGSINAVFAGVPQAGYNAVSLTCPLTPIIKNGSEDRLTFLLSPASAYTNLIRVTNPSRIAGKVYLQVIDDSGAVKNTTLSALGEASDTLNAGASSGLIPTSKIGSVTGLTGRLRLIANGDFGSNPTANADASPTGINLQSVSISKTGESFANFNSK